MYEGDDNQHDTTGDHADGGDGAVPEPETDHADGAEPDAASVDAAAGAGDATADDGDGGGPQAPASPAAGLAALSGVELATAVAEVVDQLGGLPGGEGTRGVLVDVVVAAERVKAWAASVQLGLVARLRGDFEDEILPPAGNGRRRGCSLVWDQQVDRATTAALSLALGVSFRAADRLLDHAQLLTARPTLAAALAAGRVDERQSGVIAAHSALGLDPATRDRVLDSVLADPGDPEQAVGLVRELRPTPANPTPPTIWQVPVHRLVPILARQIAATDPATHTTRERDAHVLRSVEFHTGGGQGMAQLVLAGPEQMLAAAHHRLDRLARQARTTGTPETLDQVRFDLGRVSDVEPVRGLMLGV